MDIVILVSCGYYFIRVNKNLVKPPSNNVSICIGCKDSEFKCESGSPVCIDAGRKCDNRLDCQDGSDELDCCKSFFEQRSYSITIS